MAASAVRIAQLYFAASMILFSACVPNIPPEALQLRAESLALRQLQTRKFDTAKEKDLLIGAASVLQDLGFNIDESETSLGLIVGSKERDATDAGQIAGAVILSILFGTEVDFDKEQKIRASIVTTPSDRGIALRVTFQRIVWNTNNQISKTESLEEPLLYQEFFDKLSKAVFLTAHSL